MSFNPVSSKNESRAAREYEDYKRDQGYKRPNLNIITSKTKKCNKCKKDRPISNFSLHKSSPDGLSYTCKTCKNEYARQHYHKNKKGKNIITKKTNHAIDLVKLKKDIELYGLTDAQIAKAIRGSEK